MNTTNMSLLSLSDMTTLIFNPPPPNHPRHSTVEEVTHSISQVVINQPDRGLVSNLVSGDTSLVMTDAQPQ
jgi:hypothetical protein